MIVGLTHSAEGQVKIRRTITTKVAIGIGPTAASNHPSTIDHFRILKKGIVDGKINWVLDTEKQDFYKKQSSGNNPTSLSIVLLDDDPEVVLRTEFAWYSATGKKCWGDGESATRRNDNGENRPYTPCANHGCKDYERGDCKPSADLYFMLADFPSLGTACRLHTSSYQSIPELHSALVDLRAMFGGRLLGLPIKLFMRPEKNVYTGDDGRRITGKTKYILGLELSAASLPKMLESVAESAKVFSELRQLMRGHTLEIEEDDDRDEEIVGEFYPADKLLSAAPAVEDPLIAECKALMEAGGVNAAGQSMMLGQYQGRLAELKALITKESPKSEANPSPAPVAEAGQPRRAGKGKGRKPVETGGTPVPKEPATAPTPEPQKTGFAF